MEARLHSPARAVRIVLLGGCFFVLLLAAASWAQEGASPSAPPVTLPNEPLAVEGQMRPYVAEIIGNDVYIRSGPGTNFYHCGKLYTGDRVQVVNSQQGWSCIVPPPGCFSWISMKYVSINLQNPTMGIITGDNVGVYAGSDYVEPMHSTSKQVTLSRGQMVKLLGEEKDDYYKIAVPQKAYLWVSSQFTRATAPVLGRPPEVDVGAMVKTEAGNPVKVDPNAPPKTDLELYYVLGEQIKAEHDKPIAEQDYAEIKKKLVELAAKEDGGRAARYAEYTIKQVERYELARTAAKELELQNKELQKVTTKIDAARAARLTQVVDRSKYALMGKFENSSVYNAAGQAKRYRMLDESGKTICYVSPTGSAATTDLSKFVGHKVGLVGKIEPHMATARALVEFTEIVAID